MYMDSRDTTSNREVLLEGFKHGMSKIYSIPMIVY